MFFVPLSELDELLGRLPIHWRHFGSLVTYAYRLAVAVLDELASAPAEVRLVRRLIYMSAGPAGDVARLEKIKIRQEHLAQMLGMSRSSISPLLQRLRNAGMINLSYGSITIENLEGLRQLARLQHLPEFASFYPRVKNGP